MSCFECGNCRQEGSMYYCTAKNEFVIKEETSVLEKMKVGSAWKKGDPQYEKRRRNKKDGEVQKIS